MREEYDQLLNSKNSEITKLNEQLDEQRTILTEEKESNRKKIDSKEIECHAHLVNIENIKRNLILSQEELKQAKLRLDSLKSNEKENKSNYETTLSHLERENEKLHSLLSLKTNEAEESITKFDALKCQLKKYEQLIDNLNEQIITIKRDSKEIQMNFIQVCQNLEVEKEQRIKLEAQQATFQKEFNEGRLAISTNQNLQKNLITVQNKYKQAQTQLGIKNAELTKLQQLNEQNNKIIESSEIKLRELTEANFIQEAQVC